MFVTEVVASSGLESAPWGNSTLFFGDANQPSSNASGQQQQLANTLCVLQGLGASNIVYHGFYDSASWWTKYANLFFSDLSWNGFFGLAAEQLGGAYKPALNGTGNIVPHYGSLACGSLPKPVVAINTAPQIVDSAASVLYSATDVDQLTLSPSPSQQSGTNFITGSGLGYSYSCYAAHPLDLLIGTSLLGSCAWSPLNLTSSQTITLTGTLCNGSCVSTTATASVTKISNPQITAISDANNGQTCNTSTNAGCPITATQKDTLVLLGFGFTTSQGNTVSLTGTQSTTLGLGLNNAYFWDGDGVNPFNQINAQIPCSVAPGTYTLQVVTPGSVSSTGYSINIVHGGGC